MTYNINIKESSQKKIIVEALKTMIRNNNPEPQATYLCNQLDDASCISHRYFLKIAQPAYQKGRVPSDVALTVPR